MKKKRTISINDPKLRKIRDNLRVLLSKAASTEWRKYFDERHKLHMDLNGNYRNLSNSKKPRAAELTKKMREIHKFEEISIIQCPVCKRIDQSMTFNPELKQWFCTKCYKDMGELYYEWQRKEGRALKLLYDDFDEGYYKTFLG